MRARSAPKAAAIASRAEPAVPLAAEPLVAAREHARDEAGGLALVAVEVGEQVRDRVGARVVALEHRERAHGRLVEQVARVVHEAGLPPEAREHGHLARERGVEGVDGLDAQARRVLQEAPAALRVARERIARQRVRAQVVAGGLRGGLARRRLQRLEDAPLHLAGRLAREGDGEDLLGPAHAGQQPQVALDEEPRLARAGRRLDDERAARVERLLAHAGVGDGTGAHSSSSSSAPASSASARPTRPSTRHRVARSHQVHEAKRFLGSTRACPAANSAARRAVACRHASRSSSHEACSLPPVRCLSTVPHAGQQPFLAREAQEAVLALLQAGEGDRAHLLAGRQRVERQLRVVGPLAEPARRRAGDPVL